MSRLSFARLPIRQRLTALYGVVFFLAGGLIVLAMYLLVTVELENQPSLAQEIEGSLVQRAPTEAPLPDDAGELGQVVPRMIEVADQTRREDTRNSLLRQSLIVLGLVGAIALVIGHQLAGRALRPLRAITATARRVADRSLHERIALEGPRDEIKELADTFDAMLERLDDAFRGQRHFVANASHELRTPLTVERTMLEVALEDPDASSDLRTMGRELLDLNFRSERLIESLLTLARSEHAVAERRRTDLAGLAGAAIATSAPELEARDIAVHSHLLDAPVQGEPDLLRHLVLNLVQNAIRHNHTGGELWVTTEIDDADAVLRIGNTGPQIRADDAMRIFEPFQRLDAQRTGTSHGLGLSIVRSVAHNHGGSVTAEPREAGGLDVTVRIPAADAEPGTALTAP